MPSHGELLRIARRYDTQMAHAMLRALGFGPVKAKPRKAPRGNAHRKADRARYRAMRWCFENHGSPLR